MMETSEQMIELLVASVSTDTSEYNRQVFRDALFKLVRLAQAEKLASVQQDFHAVERAVSQNYKRYP
ncbi:MAG: hypothetical protein JWQ23_3546 [Herminiimonas sp.]|jgi:hypothetical protein|nr:hypothetical protein [Herminiimonas sp.]